MIALLFLLCTAQFSQADELEGEWYANGMVGIVHDRAREVKQINIGRKFSWMSKPVWFLIDTGLFVDPRPERKTSLTTAFMVGTEVSNHAVFASWFTGPGVIYNWDKDVGGPFQFFHEGTVGFKDSFSGVKLGISFRHYSNWGIYNNNSGRDFLGLKVYLPF
jgi:hypothetical protein